MKRELLLFLTLFFMLPFSNIASAQLPPPPAPGCPSTFLFQDGNYWVYEKVLCLESIGTCTPTPTTPISVLVYGAVCANTDPPCGTPCGECNSACVPVGSGVAGGGPIAYQSNGKGVTKNKGASVKEFNEFVGEDSNGVWYKFNDMKVKKDGNTKIFKVCFKIGTAPARKGDAGVDPAKSTPAEWFIADKINAVETISGSKTVEVRFKDNTMKTYTILMGK